MRVQTYIIHKIPLIIFRLEKIRNIQDTVVGIRFKPATHRTINIRKLQKSLFTSNSRLH
ncbi:hypothetical protein CF161_28289 [Pseudomonas sp. CF161]|nr:hypothetical protein CF161_28289 [Pseudomonas sp. CF161]